MVKLVKDTKVKWIQEVVESPSFKKGDFTRKADEHKMSTKDFMREVLYHPEDYDVHTRRQAQFMKNIQRKR